MSTNQIPNFDKMIIPTLDILFENKKEMKIVDIDEKLLEIMQLDKSVCMKKHLNTKQSEFSYRAAWARTYLKKYGVIDNPERSIWKVNDIYNGEKLKSKDIVNAVRENRRFISINNKKKQFSVDNNNESNIKILSEKYRKKRIALFLGAGVSITANMPSWDELVARFLIERFHETKQDLDEDTLQKLIQFEKFNRENSLISQTRFIKQNIPPEKYIEMLMHALYQNEKNIHLDSPLLNSLVQFIWNKNEIYVRKIITFNFDNILERKLKNYGIYYKTYTNHTEDIDTRPVYIYHVHGFLDSESDLDGINIDDIVFSEEQYHNIYNDPYHWSNMTQVNTLRENTCLFIGCSLSDPNMRRLLDIAKSDSEIKHYAIMKKETIKIPVKISEDDSSYQIYKDFHIENRNDYFNSLGLNIIWVDKFEEIPGIINQIIDKI